VSGGAAILCDSEDYEGFAQAILSLVREPARRDELSRRGLANAGRYGRPAMIDQFVDLYEQVLRSA
jgi:glycosyltransferase involved in cell wall biosynthesis